MAGKFFGRLAKKSGAQRVAAARAGAARASYGRNALLQARIGAARGRRQAAPGIGLPSRPTTNTSGMRTYAGAFSAKVNVNPRL